MVQKHSKVVAELSTGDKPSDATIKTINDAAVQVAKGYQGAKK
jgi:hypothetical protein